METSDLKLPETPKPRTEITPSEFHTEPTIPVRYTYNQPLTRDNFISWLTMSFAVSRGEPTVQYGFVRWTSARVNFDFEETLNNFVQAGSGNCLSDRERQVIRTAFNKVSEHSNQEFGEIDPVDILEYYAAKYADTSEGMEGEQHKKGILRDFPSLVTFDNLSQAEFLAWADKKYAETLARRERNRLEHERRAREGALE